MKNKILISGIIAILLFFTTSYCYASQNNKNDSETVNLGNQITESINKTEKSAEELTNKVTNNNMVNGMKNMVNDGVQGATDMVKDGYNVTKTSLDNSMNEMGITDTTWIWVMLAVVGIVILAAVWFYAIQNSGRD